LLDPVRRLQRPSFLDTAEYCQQFRRFYISDSLFPQPGEDIVFQSADDCTGMSFGPGMPEFRVPFHSNGLQGILGLFPQFHLDHLLMQTWIDIILEQSMCFVAFFPRLLETELGVHPM
jgi:hypothetical protein